MFCKMIGICGGCTSKANIKDEMNHKSNFIQSLFGLDSLEIFDSPDVGYRTRAEFRIHTEKYENQKNQSKQQQVANQEQQKQEQEGQKKQQEQQKQESCDTYQAQTSQRATQAQNAPQMPQTQKMQIFLAMSAFGENKRVKITHCPILLPAIQIALQSLLEILNDNNQILESKLYAIEVLGTLNGGVMITLIYHKTLDTQWRESALAACAKINEDMQNHHYNQPTNQLANQFNQIKNQAHIIGRSRKQKVILTQDTLLDEIYIQGKSYIYFRQEGRFSQPNAYTNPKMIEFVKSHIITHHRVDLLEMYCGDGNFSIALACDFRQVFATEIVKSCALIIQKNIFANNIKNITHTRLSGEETIQALCFEREFFRLRGIDLGRFRFSHILIDPPRSGIKDHKMLQFIASFQYIIYISCNPLSLKKDLEILGLSHKILHFAVFNQFPHTEHIECGVILEKTNS
ncbi:tRNA (uridine(54)-C5)-methyltransferase TrmA [Helicobacter fennelliae]|nr:tRNA (uridine(54)-C5)-methyltransferase TrmA [Helicobacter fennelliae]STP08558.1 tRNA (uracil-5)-methyltransferase [Helicobacter fennelliae]STQ84368.1 tRNA (uracil-5)-methyltransferase [Helicobacter fennelliae]